MLPNRLPDLPGSTVLTRGFAAVRDRLPPPSPVLGFLDRHSPWALKQALAELPLNHLFGDAIREGEFDEFEGRTLRLELEDARFGVTVGLWQGRFRLVDGPGEVVIRGTLEAFRVLAERREDPDQLFFQRRLVIEGDVELGLGVKNLLDSLEWGQLTMPGRLWLRAQAGF